MKNKIHGKKWSILAAGYISAAFLVACGFAVQGHVRAAAYENTLNNVYQHAFSELTSAVYEVDTDLQKLSYATSPSLIASLCAEVFGKATAAQRALGELPYGNVELEHTAAFVAKVGDYAYALSKSAANSGVCDTQERQNVRALSTAAASLSQMLTDLEADIYSGSVTMEDLNRAEAQLSASEGAGGITAGSSYQNIESEFPEVPSLVYDGPFSEHLSKRTPKLLEGKAAYSQGQALTAAADFLRVKPEILTLTNTIEGSLPAWGFSGTIEGGEVYLEVSQKGGMVVQMLSSRPVGEAAFSAGEAEQAAMEFLTARGYQNLVPSYYMNQNHILTINLAHSQDGVICYPDLVKVSVALDTCRVVGFEARGYLTNHTGRTLPQPAVSEADAQVMVGEDLNILSHQLALIPSLGEHEILCHEFKCEAPDGRHYLVYVNAQNGSQERILILLEDESGTLAI